MEWKSIGKFPSVPQVKEVRQEGRRVKEALEEQHSQEVFSLQSKLEERGEEVGGQLNTHTHTLEHGFVISVTYRTSHLSNPDHTHAHGIVCYMHNVMSMENGLAMHCNLLALSSGAGDAGRAEDSPGVP